MTSDGRPYAPTRLAELVEERYQISKHLHTSYNDVGEMTPLERDYILKYIARDIQQENEMLQKARGKK